MLLTVFYEKILKTISSKIPYPNIDTENINSEQQIELIEKYLTNSTYRKTITKLDGLKKIRNMYSDIQNTYDDIDDEIKIVISKIDKCIKEVNEKVFIDYNSFFDYYEELMVKEDKEVSLYNAFVLRLLSYEGVKECQLKDICMSDFKVDYCKRTPEFYIEINNTIIPIHKKTYEYITSKPYAIEYIVLNKNGVEKLYKYYNYIRNGKLSIYRTTEENTELTDDKYLNMKKNSSRGEIKTSLEKAYRYGRYENIFRIEMEYENAENLFNKKASKLFEYIHKELFDNPNETSASIISNHNDYIRWRKLKIEDIMLQDFDT